MVTWITLSGSHVVAGVRRMSPLCASSVRLSSLPVPATRVQLLAAGFCILLGGVLPLLLAACFRDHTTYSEKCGRRWDKNLTPDERLETDGQVWY